jgi:hypothetical protein
MLLLGGDGWGFIVRQEAGRGRSRALGPIKAAPD